MILHDQHIHSSFSNDSNEPLESYYKIASEKGIDYVITCEHYDPHTVVDSTTWHADYNKLMKLQEEYKLKYPNVKSLLGIELGYRPEYLEEMIEYISNYQFDLIQFSLHDDGKVDFFFTPAFEKDTIGMTRYYLTRLYEGMQVFKDYDVLSHIDFGFKTARYINKEIKISMFEDIIKKIFNLIIKEGKAFEVNTKVQEKINDDEHIEYLLNLYRSLGGERVTLSSDAHEKERYMSSFPKYLGIIKKCGFNELCYYIKRKEYRYKI